MSSEPIRISQPHIRFGSDFELDLRAYELRRSGKPLKLERIPMEVLVMLIERHGELVSRDQIVKHIWGKDVFLDTDNSINAAIRKIRQVLKDDPDRPRFVVTVTGKGYRFVAPVEEPTPPRPQTVPVVPEPLPDSENLLGRKISHYRVTQMLGGGGMGVVYKAEDLKLGRAVALKFLSSELASDPIAFERLQREARAASALDHPNICSIYLLGEHEGQPFIVMPFLEGETLREWIQRAANKSTAARVKSVIELAVQIADGLEAAHHKGIIHRDIKPTNIFITNGGRAKILDFGVAKFIDAAELGEGKSTSTSVAVEGGMAALSNPHLTRTGASVGTPSYLSPEQICGNKLDARSDIFSFGLVLYEMATGKRAFSGNTATEIRDAVLNFTVLPARQLNPELPGSLEDIISRCLEKDPVKRYQTGADVRADLIQLSAISRRRFVRPLRIADRPPSTLSPLQSLPQGDQEKRWPRYLKPLLAAILMLALVAGALVAYEVATSTTKQSAIRSVAVLPLQNISGDSAQQYLADGITEEIIGRLAGIRDLRVISRTSVMRFKDTQLTVPEIAKVLHVDAILEGSVMRDGNRIRVHAQLIRAVNDEHFWSESYDRDLRDVLAMDADVAQAVTSKVEVTVTGEEHQRLRAVRPVSPEVYENYLKGKFASDKGNSKADVEESIRFFDEAIKKDPTFAPGYLGLALAYWNMGSVFMGGVAERERPKAVLAAQRALELDPDLADAHVLMALIAETQWRWAEAESEYHRALDLRPNDAAAYSGLAWWLDCQGRTEEAVTMRRHARELDPLAVSGANLGWDLFFARRYDQAIQELHSVLAVKPDDAFALWILGFVLIANHHPQAAIPELERGVSSSGRSPAVMGLLVNAYAQAGRLSDALRLLDELHRRRRTEYVPATAFVLAYLGLGNYDQSFVWLERAYKEQSYALQTLKVLPLFDPIRSDPRFVDLLHRVGLDRPN